VGGGPNLFVGEREGVDRRKQASPLSSSLTGLRVNIQRCNVDVRPDFACHPGVVAANPWSIRFHCEIRLLRAHKDHRRIRPEPSISLSAAGRSAWPAPC